MEQILQRIAGKISGASHILIGGGAGLSAPVISYLDEDEFRASYPMLAARGIKNRWQAIWTRAQSAEEHWGLWATHIKQVRYDLAPGRVYLDLLDLVRGKNYYVISTNVDRQFHKAGFDPERLFTPQGDYGMFQCSVPCRKELVPNEEIVRGMVARMDADKLRVRTEDLPVCPWCGAKMAVNLRMDNSFVEDPWMKAGKSYTAFVKEAAESAGEFLLLEFGVGFNTPSIIRFPFEYYAGTYDNCFLARFNLDSPDLPPALEGRSASVKGDIGALMSSLREIAAG